MLHTESPLTAMARELLLGRIAMLHSHFSAGEFAVATLGCDPERMSDDGLRRLIVRLERHPRRMPFVR